ncbi:MAG: PLP-dependent aminotransferase family protein [Butyrivibrio sp.]
MVKYADRLETMEGSATIIKNLFNAMTDAETISFGGGSPAKEALPVDIVREIVNEIMTTDKKGIAALQYGDPYGYLELREVVRDYLLAPKGVKCDTENILITTGGIEGMNLICQIFINPGDVILVESPTFVHCVEIFEMFQAKCIAVETDEYGMVIEDVEKKIKEYNPKIVYVVPTFQNPTGKTLPTERRKALAELGSKYDIVILEDDPYRDIRYSGTDLPPIKSFDKTGNTVMANSFSKIFSPGSRLGYVVATKELIDLFYQIQTATVSVTSTLSQVICAEFFKRGYYPDHHKMICDLYRERRDVMLQCFDKYFPPEVKHTVPDGGMFIWVTCPEHIDTTELLKEANENKVAYVAGEGFYVEGNKKGSNCMRMSFTGVTPENIEIGMQRLGKLISSKM